MAHSLVAYNESALEVAEKLYAEQGRQLTLRMPANVSPEDLVKHELTHHPRLSSCEACVRARSREDNRPDVETKPEATACRDGVVVFSMDYGFWGDCKFLAAHDSEHGSILGIPVCEKGPRGVKYMIEEMKTKFFRVMVRIQSEQLFWQ